MTALNGVVVFRKHQHRIFEDLEILVSFLDAMAVGMHFMQFGNLGVDLYVKTAATKYQSNQFKPQNLWLGVPYGTLTASAIRNIPAEVIGIDFDRKFEPTGTVSEAQHIRSYVAIHNGACGAVFIAFWERHFPWIKDKFGTGNRDAWPPLIQFCYVIRNACVHRGELQIRGAFRVSWYGLTYTEADNGRQILATDLAIADIIILMIELAEELDRLGCPRIV